MTTTQVLAWIPKVGYFPNTFPRDPVEINNFHEHVVIGQIIEPLVESSTSGEVVPSVASSWEISTDAKTIIFHIRPNLKFSNGKEVTSADVKYTLERHKKSTISQSRSYLSIITKIETLDSRRLKVTLERPYVAFFKSLSRDHLGIVPDGWTFDTKSNEPIVGTGPYRILRKDDSWFLTKNSNYRDVAGIAISDWEIVLFDPKKLNYAELPVADLVTSAQPEIKQIIENNARSQGKTLTSVQINHFVQMSGWWYPHGVNYSDSTKQTVVMTALSKLLSIRGTKLGYRLTTGVIPEGIAGYIAPVSSIAKQGAQAKTRVTARIAVVEKDLKTLADESDVKLVEDTYNVRFVFEPVAITNFTSLRETKPDAVVLAHAGGFHDPEGFIVVVSSVLSTDLQTLFGKMYQTYLDCSSEMNWNKRAEKYRNLNERLVTSHVLAPGWKPPLFQLSSAAIESLGQGVGYTTKLINFKQRERKEDEDGVKH